MSFVLEAVRDPQEDHVSQDQATWQLTGTLAGLATAKLRGQVDLQQPQLGLHDLHLAESCEVSRLQLLQLSLPGAAPREELQECWVRGSDLVAVYAPNARRASRPEIYWRVIRAADAIGVELIVSVQTALLDDHPSVSIRSEFPAGNSWWLVASGEAPTAHKAEIRRSPNTKQVFNESGACVARLSERMSYVEMIHPTDFGNAEVELRDDRIVLGTPLFLERLEKGVIRRGRIQSWFVPAKGDLATAARLLREFAQSEPPLTT